MAAGVAARLAAVRSDYAFAMTDAVLMALSYLLVLLATSTSLGHGPGRLVWLLVVAPTVHLLCNAAFGLYGRVWQHAGIDEARAMLMAGTSAVAVLCALAVAADRAPTPVLVLGPTIATLMIGVSRFRSRLFARQRGSRNSTGARVAVIGAGRTGATVIRDLVADRQSGYSPVVVVDDDRRLHGRTLGGIPIAGAVDDLPDIGRSMVVHQVVLAIPSAEPALVRHAADIAAAMRVPLKIVPSFRELISGISPFRQVRQPRIEDLLGRNQVSTDLGAVADLVAGRSVLLTGAGGSIGAEIARQVAQFAPDRLVLLDHDETHLHDAAARIHAELGLNPTTVLADIRPADEMHDVVRRFRPDIVFHAAAHKHVPILERYPLEAIRTNVFGTLNILEAAQAGGIDRFVFISTDKAVRPTSVLGASKRLGEQLVASLAGPPGCYCAVRFGNVLGSRGSVVPTFTRQIAAGGPVTITDPHMTRFFMSVEEAVQLVLQSAVFTTGNDLFMLEMGSPVRIIDLARQMIRLSGHAEHEIGVVITGSRPGEKQSEELYAPYERVTTTAHPSISRVLSPGISEVDLRDGLARLRCLLDKHLEEEAKSELFALASASAEPVEGMSTVTITLPGPVVLPQPRPASVRLEPT